MPLSILKLKLSSDFFVKLYIFCLYLSECKYDKGEIFSVLFTVVHPVPGTMPVYLVGAQHKFLNTWVTELRRPVPTLCPNGGNRQLYFSRADLC